MSQSFRPTFDNVWKALDSTGAPLLCSWRQEAIKTSLIKAARQKAASHGLSAYPCGDDEDALKALNDATVVVTATGYRTLYKLYVGIQEKKR